MTEKELWCQEGKIIQMFSKTFQIGSPLTSIFHPNHLSPPPCTCHPSPPPQYLFQNCLLVQFAAHP